MKKISPQEKAAITTKERHGDDFFSKIGKHNNRVLKGNSEAMRELAQLRWKKHNEDKANKLKEEE
tara:strand:+ start:1171 stop:1365 length:195 start_codon:yes stop_codon:yes gene_type:complete